MTTGRVLKRNGGWGYVISLPYDPVKGRYPQQWRSGFTTKQEASDAMARDLSSLAEGTVAATGIKVADYLQDWLTKSKSQLAPRTFATYEETCRLYIIPHIGHHRLSKLKPMQIENMYEQLSQKLAPSTVHRAHRVLKRALNRAVRWGYLTRNPINQVDSPSNRSEERIILNPGQVMQVLDWLEARYPVTHLAAYLVVATGMRREEVAGLRWIDINQDPVEIDSDGTLAWKINIHRTRQRIKKTEIIGATKTYRSARPILVDEEVFQVLRDWQKKHLHYAEMRGEAWDPDSFILQHLDGNFMDPNTLSKDFRKAIKALKLPNASFYSLRHTHATYLLETNVSLKAVSERLGHSSTKLTADTYTHITTPMEREAVVGVRKMLRKAKQDNAKSQNGDEKFF